MARLLCAAALVLLALATVVSATKPGSGCTNKVTGYSPMFGIAKENKPLTYKDQTSQWQKFGQITKVNLYYSWNFKCLQGWKTTYGWDAKNALLLGHEVKGLTTADIKLAAYEWITKVEVRQQPTKCIEYIKLYTNKGKTLVMGDTKSAAPLQTATINRKAGFLAAIRGWETKITKGGKDLGADLQQLQFVWAVEECPKSPKPAPVPKPTPPASPPPESPGPVEGPPEESPAPTPTPTPTPTPSPEPTPTPAPTPKPTVCKAQPTMCNTGVDLGVASFCPFVNPFTASVCLGGCCQSAGKCKAPFCSLAGLGADVMTLDFICLGRNDGPFGGLNKCKNLGCKLAVPGCVSDLLGGSCLGTVTAVTTDVAPEAKKYLGMPCLETTKKLLPIDILGKIKGKGEYVSGLWTVCDCNAQNPQLPTLPEITLPTIALGCKGPLCALVPKLPEFNLTLPDLQIPFALLSNLTDLLTKDPAVTLPPITDIIKIQKPEITLPQINITDLQLPTLPKFPTPTDLKQIFDTITGAIGAVSDAQAGQPNPIATLLSSIPSLIKPFELPKFNLTIG